MLVNLANGRTISISVEYFLNMTDDSFQQLLASDAGDHIDDPFHESVLRHGEDVYELSEDELERAATRAQDLLEISSFEKAADLDLDLDDI